MSETQIAPTPVEAYLSAMTQHLGHLPAEEREEVIEELRDDLDEVAAEHDGPLVDLLGPPEDYVASYLASAGLEAGAPDEPTRSSRVSAAVGAIQRWVHDSPNGQRAGRVAVLLRPAWWSLRGAVAAIVAAGILAGGGFIQHVPIPFGGPLGVVFLLAAVAGSIWLGQWVAAADMDSIGWRSRTLLLAGNVVAVVAALGLLNSLGNFRNEVYAEVANVVAQDVAPVSPFLSLPNGEPITNIYPYDRDGNALEDVFLYDAVGQPIELFAPGEGLAFADLEIDYDRARDGSPLTNSFPLDQFLLECCDENGQQTRVRRLAPDVRLPALDVEPTTVARDPAAPEADATEPVSEPTSPEAGSAETTLTPTPTPTASE